MVEVAAHQCAGPGRGHSQRSKLLPLMPWSKVAGVGLQMGQQSRADSWLPWRAHLPSRQDAGASGLSWVFAKLGQKELLHDVTFEFGRCQRSAGTCPERLVSLMVQGSL